MAEEIKEATPEVADTQPTETTPSVPEQPKVKTYSEQEYNALKTQLDNLKQSTKDNEDFKKKFEQSEQARKDFEYQTKVNEFVKSQNLDNDIYESYLKSQIAEKKLQFDEDDELIGGKKLVEQFKSKYPQAFKSAKIPRFADNTQGKAYSVAEDTLRKIMGLKPKN